MARNHESERERLDRRLKRRPQERGSLEESLRHLGEGAQYLEGWEEYSWLGQPERKHTANRKRDDAKKAHPKPSIDSGGSEE